MSKTYKDCALRASGRTVHGLKGQAKKKERKKGREGGEESIGRKRTTNPINLI